MGTDIRIFHHRNSVVNCGMGQIFDRIKNIARAYASDVQNDSSWAERTISAYDDELHQPPANQPPALSREILKAHTTLNVAVGSSPDDVKMAYRTAISQWHPDKFVTASQGEQATAHSRAHEINAAYKALKNHYRIS